MLQPNLYCVYQADNNLGTCTCPNTVMIALNEIYMPALLVNKSECNHYITSVITILPQYHCFMCGIFMRCFHAEEHYIQ